MTPACGHYLAALHRHCGATDDVCHFLPGLRCPLHTPAALAGRPEVPATSNRSGASTMEPHSAADVLLRNAIRYADHGWPVFLLGRTKRPLANCDTCKDARTEHDPAACECLTCHGFYAATTDAERLTAMLAANPRGMLAIRTGGPSRTVVVDIDPAHGGRIDPALMPQTACVATGSGGWHLYYRHPETPVPCSQGRLGAGVDVRGDGGYVVAPPSTHPRTGRPYRWTGGRTLAEMPPALLEACRPNEAPAMTAPAGPTPVRSAGGISSPTALLRAHLDAIAKAPAGKRRTTLYGAARGVARMVAAGAIDQADALAALTDAGRAADQTPREIRTAIAGAFRDEHVATEGIAA